MLIISIYVVLHLSCPCLLIIGITRESIYHIWLVTECTSFTELILGNTYRQYIVYLTEDCCFDLGFSQPFLFLLPIRYQ